jgi:hypothetical protein
LENSQKGNSDRLRRLGDALVALANKMEPQAAAEIAKALATVLENPQETDPERLSLLGGALAALANKMEPQAAAGNKGEPGWLPRPVALRYSSRSSSNL